MKSTGTILAVVFVLLHLCCGSLWAGITTSDQAEMVVTGWLKTNSTPLETVIGGQVKNVETFTNDSVEPIYYIVYLQSSGFVIVSADDRIEPIIGFVEKGIYNPSIDDPLGALVNNDLKAGLQ